MAHHSHGDSIPISRIDRDEIPSLLRPMGIEIKSKDDQRHIGSSDSGSNTREKSLIFMYVLSGDDIANVIVIVIYYIIRCFFWLEVGGSG